MTIQPQITTPENLGVLLDQKAKQSPSAAVLNFIEEDKTLTYEELRQTVNKTANAYNDLGIGRRCHVAIMSGNCLSFIASWLALAKLGAVTIAVNMRYTARELDYVLDDSEASFLIIDPSHVSVYENSNAAEGGRFENRIITTETANNYHHSWPKLIKGQSGEFNGRDQITREDLSNIQYTSGTTGFPKGCMLPHSFWLHSSKVMVLELGFDLKRVIYNQNFFYMDGPFLMTACMHAGACLFVVTTPSAKRFVQWIRDFRIQYCFFFEAIYKIPESPRDGDNSMLLLQTFGFNKANHSDLERRFHTKAREAYGMTECGGVLSMPLSDNSKIGSGSCGKPHMDREASIRDEYGKPVPVGEVGELWVRGPGMMIGYYNNPTATKNTIIDGWLRTGDLFRCDKDGYYTIVGRQKDMVRRNGENIACREVEAVLRELRGIKEVAVVPVPDDRVGEEVKSYILLQDGESPDSIPPKLIIQHCETRLATFKIPRYIAYRDYFPMTDSDRVEKQKVIAADPEPTSDTYDRITNCWR